MRLLCLILALLACASCAAKQDIILTAYENRGPLPLDPSNPYVGTNRLLERAMEHNAIMQCFIGQAGMPEAIEVRKRLFRPYRLYLFYPKRGEAYLAEQVPGEWLITGPEKISEDVLDELKKIAPRRAETAQAAPAPVQEDHQAQAALQAPKPLSARRKTEALEKAADEPSRPADLNEQQATAAAEAEIVPRTARYSADVRHHVAYAGETLRLIAEWYTGAADNSKLIASYNGLSNPNRIGIGDVIRIPSYMAKRRTALPLQEVDRYQSSLNDEARSAGWEDPRQRQSNHDSPAAP